MASGVKNSYHINLLLTHCDEAIGIPVLNDSLAGKTDCKSSLAENEVESDKATLLRLDLELTQQVIAMLSVP